jgi:outer membrane protein TolC
VISYYDLLIAQQQSQQARLDLIGAQAKRLINDVSFYQAMGGGISYDGKATASPQ